MNILGSSTENKFVKETVKIEKEKIIRIEGVRYFYKGINLPACQSLDFKFLQGTSR